MTREEIISGLKFTVEMFLLDPSAGETITEPRNDMDKITIDACRGAIKELQDNSYELWKESYEVEHERNFRLEEKINALEQESKTGHWKVVSDGYGDSAYICECSECKDTVWVYKDADRKWNYCPNCGAKMKEGE